MWSTSHMKVPAGTSWCFASLRSALPSKLYADLDFITSWSSFAEWLWTLMLLYEQSSSTTLREFETFTVCSKHLKSNYWHFWVPFFLFFCYQMVDKMVHSKWTQACIHPFTHMFIQWWLGHLLSNGPKLEPLVIFIIHLSWLSKLFIIV